MNEWMPLLHQKFYVQTSTVHFSKANQRYWSHMVAQQTKMYRNSNSFITHVQNKGEEHEDQYGHRRQLG